MSTPPSSEPWADGPHKLITTPASYLPDNGHSALYCATEMAHSHNCLLRSLNALVLQTPCIPDSTLPGYNPVDVSDLLFYASAWAKMVDHHHHTEETCMFPLIEELANEPGLLSHARDQHAGFHDGLERLREYADEMRKEPERYRTEALMGIVKGFEGSLVEHLREEIGEILALERLDSAGLMKCWKQAEEVAKAKGKIAYLYDIFPVVLGSCDKTFEGGNEFPPLPSFMPYAIKYWFGTYQPGAWRFLPCDFWGRPKELEMLK